MEIWKLSSGIMSICFFVIMLFQSCILHMEKGIYNGLPVTAAADVICAMLILTGGIVSIVTRKMNDKSVDKALAIIFAIAALIGIWAQDEFGDLLIWSIWALANMTIAYRSYRRLDREQRKDEHLD